MKIKYIILLVLCISIVPARSSAAAEKSEEKENLIREAKYFFNRCVAMEQSFDPAAFELMSDDAKVENIRIYPTGMKRKMTLSGAQYKELVRKVLPLAKLRGDTNRYFNMTFTLEGEMAHH
jgi:predicted DNA binding CopG/RHH family protein